MAQQSRMRASRTGRPGRAAWWPALWAFLIAFTVVVSSGAVLLTAQVMDAESRPAPTSDRIATIGAGTQPSSSPAPGPEET